MWSCASPSLTDSGFFSDNNFLCGSVGTHSVEFSYHKSDDLGSSLESVSDASINNELIAPNWNHHKNAWDIPGLNQEVMRMEQTYPIAIQRA